MSKLSFAKAFVVFVVIVVDKQELLGNKRTGQQNSLDSSGETVLGKFLIRSGLDSVLLEKIMINSVLDSVL